MLKKAFFKAMFVTLMLAGLIMLIVSVTSISINLEILVKYAWEIISSTSCILLGYIGIKTIN